MSVCVCVCVCKYLQSAKEGQQRGGENKNKKARKILASPASGYTSSTSSNSKRLVAGYSAEGREDGVTDQSDGKEISGGEGARDAREREAEDTRRRLRQRVVALNYKNV